ncbi:NAD(P)/FAD-dependent oxidoreductase [Methylovirgula sp. 4M-Z18]|uniref:NAD(P)/FAD-dependent oxidoreductase n=1 Tax=Methylovirgula sp. 4M-Z18 TaxID=2293567 RepID=UPI000E2F151E|nr:NAD(P)/FAD-dependent oxidoreductase [Methylovirgula sp. 4M-Z18]RFB80251.1 NAD(P)/FAD-dependent oxidoreductase [Methylovirgula sp. 4M-Z18]
MDATPGSAHVPTLSAEAAVRDIVIVGGGAAGLELATGLSARYRRSSSVKITLVDNTRTHLWKPLLHSVAAGSITASEHEHDYLALAHWYGFRFQYGEIIGLDRTVKQITLAATYDDEGRQITPERPLPYEVLVMSIGSVSNDFGTPGVAEYAVPLDTPEQAKRFHRRLVNGYLRAQTQSEPLRPGQLTVVVVGAGATGTELVAELHRTTRELVGFGLDRINPEKDIRIVLIEAGPRILPALPEVISTSTTKTLEALGIEVRTGERVAEVSAEGVRLASGAFIASDLVVWSAGVRAAECLDRFDGLETNRNHQLVVTETLQTTRDPDIFAIGDCAQCPRKDSAAPVPPRAQAAHQQAAHLARQLPIKLEGGALQPFEYRDFGSLVTLSKYQVIGNLMGFVGRDFRVEGLIARLMYRWLYLNHEMAVNGGRRSVLGTIARLLARQYRPAIKLH